MSKTKTASRPYRAVATIDFSELCDRSVEQALRLCGDDPKAELHVIVVGSEEEQGIRLPGATERVLPSVDADEVARAHVGALVEQYQEDHGRIPMERIAVYVASGHPAERIVALATEADADVIVMGTHGRTGLKRFLVGSVAEEVVQRAPCGVFVIRPRDFLRGEKLPEVQEPLHEGEHALKPFQHAPTFHYVNRISNTGSRSMPVG